MTLIELLVVIAIMVMLAGIAVPTMRPALEGRRIREAARGINVALSAARSRALEIGRPCGVMIHRFSPNLATAAIQLDEVEMPPPYSGDTLDARAEVWIQGQPGTPSRWPDGTLQVAAEIFGGGSMQNLVNSGDEIQFNDTGPLYTIRQINGSQLLLSFDDSNGQLLAWPISGGTPRSLPMPFKIFRQPVNPNDRPFATTAARTFQLPAGIVIDLEFSGTDNNALLFANTRPAPELDPVVIMFSPNGGIDRVYFTDSSLTFDKQLGVEPVYLLIGKREQLSSMAPPQLNWQDLENLWVSINPQTGLVNTSVMLQGATIYDARQMATTGRQMGGR